MGGEIICRCDRTILIDFIRFSAEGKTRKSWNKLGMKYERNTREEQTTREIIVCNKVINKALDWSDYVERSGHST